MLQIYTHIKKYIFFSWKIVFKNDFHISTKLIYNEHDYKENLMQYSVSKVNCERMQILTAFDKTVSHIHNFY
jgi:hypothetical protein